jgi:hypothetical protein
VTRNHLAHILGDGSLDASWNPNADGIVRALALSGGDLYAGGNFGSIGGQSRAFIAKLSTSGSGAADPTWDPNANSQVFALFTVHLIFSDGFESGSNGAWSSTQSPSLVALATPGQ